MADRLLPLGFRDGYDDVGGFLNDAFLGKEVIEIDGRMLSRKWVRGCGFTLDGVHPGYTGQTLIANRILEAMNELPGINAPFYDLDEVWSTAPYIDHDGDGWAPGPPQAAASPTCSTCSRTRTTATRRSGSACRPTSEPASPTGC